MPARGLEKRQVKSQRYLGLWRMRALATYLHRYGGLRFSSLPGMRDYRRLISKMSCRSVLTVAASTSPRRSMNSLVRRSSSNLNSRLVLWWSPHCSCSTTPAPSASRLAPSSLTYAAPRNHSLGIYRRHRAVYSRTATAHVRAVNRLRTEACCNILYTYVFRRKDDDRCAHTQVPQRGRHDAEGARGRGGAH